MRVVIMNYLNDIGSFLQMTNVNWNCIFRYVVYFKYYYSAHVENKYL